MWACNRLLWRGIKVSCNLQVELLRQVRTKSHSPSVPQGSILVLCIYYTRTIRLCNSYHYMPKNIQKPLLLNKNRKLVVKIFTTICRYHNSKGQQDHTCTFSVARGSPKASQLRRQRGLDTPQKQPPRWFTSTTTS